MPTEKAAAMLRRVREALKKNEPLTMEYDLPFGNGRRWFSATVSPMTAKSVLFVSRDITAAKEAEAHIRFQARLLDEVGQAVAAADLSGRIIYWNRAAVELYGWSPEEALGRGVAELLAMEGQRSEAERRISAMSDGTTRSWETRVRDKAGRTFPIQVSNSPIFDESGKQVGIVGVSVDLTERKRAEETLRQSEERFQQAQKMEAVGRLAGGIAHDFNNLLTVIRGYCDLLAENVGESGRRDVEEIQRAAISATALTSQLLAFSRKQILQPKVISLASLTAAMRHMVQRLIGEDIDLRIGSSGDEWQVRADPGKIEQVIMNLAVNARDAMPHGGTLIIETANVSLDLSYSRLHPEVREGEYVLLTVSDTGHGMDPSVMSHVFEPFFTTKEKGKGTGLGLATVYGIVKQSGGFTYCYSEPGKGTSFKVYLPRSREQGEKNAVSEPAAQPEGGTETILLVEDDDGVRGLALSILSKAGYAVIPARNGAEALDAMRDRIDLLITDVVMPGMDGPTVAQHIEKRFPGVKVVYVSGYTEDSSVYRGVLAKGARLVQKPFSMAGLLLAVRASLDSGISHEPISGHFGGGGHRRKRS